MKKIRLYILTLILSGIFISCSTSRHNASAYSSEPIMEQTSSDLFSEKNDKSLYYTKTIERKINFSAFLSLIVDKPDTANVHIENIAKKYNGYVNEIGTYRTIIRVKSENLDEAIKEISALGKVKSKNILGQDVTEEYSDYQIRLDNAEKARKRYLELLAKAEDVQATLKVEKELERLNETIELLKAKMNRINHLSEFSTITISLKEKKKPGILGYIGIGLYNSVKWLFVRN
jgi:hypothetical protein